ncbi:MAG: Short-chain dehydrogenase [uncultured Gemmatimonadetes bacterium]|uniref:Short-chain dehydrogenase n=1 Tax=uncultured Gemmatimonadota bacterium TaxID=203437 RepID=A0A6J4MCU2_9BACT|nr:MAG: Short-chain dehydrogenase [uncultured Gemmatimonadota bacterium]
MRVLVVGATGTIGQAVVEALGGHEMIRVGSTSGEVQADISRPESIRELFQSVGEVDAVVSCAGSARFRPLAELGDDDFAFSIANKLMGQVNLVRLGMEHVRDGGSFTLTSGILSQVPMPGSAAISLVNGGLEAFARAAALEAPRGIRVNTVSPPWVSETLAQMGQDPSGGLPAAVVALAYLASVHEEINGTVIDPRRYA